MPHRHPLIGGACMLDKKAPNSFFFPYSNIFKGENVILDNGR
tara:strand:+ start:497 stop:622 length:126 start_codon:yes stop_codon:yes gene_type:complete